MFEAWLNDMIIVGVAVGFVAVILGLLIAIFVIMAMTFSNVKQIDKRLKNAVTHYYDDGK
jgi:archaellum component FlaF (FlaF/FlaG flagellin family)